MDSLFLAQNYRSDKEPYWLDIESIRIGFVVGWEECEYDNLYNKTKKTVQKNINSPKFDDIITYLFTHPVLNAEKLADALSVSHGQAMRYLNVLESEHILLGNDKKRNRTFYFAELIELARGI